MSFLPFVSAGDGEEEGGDDAEMEGDAEGDEAEVEGDAEGQDEGDATAEKVLDQSTRVPSRITCLGPSPRFNISFHTLFIYFFSRTARMRKWVTCSWLGRCWK